LSVLALTSFQSVLAADPIFADNFESGNLLAWTARKTDFGDLKAVAVAAMEGSWGMRARIDDNTPIYVTDGTPASEVSYKAKFMFDPNSIGMANRDTYTIFLGQDLRTGYVPALRIEFRKVLSGYQLRAGTPNDASAWINTTWFAITNQSPAVEVEWDAPNPPDE
jgi:hypothetical protein